MAKRKFIKTKTLADSIEDYQTREEERSIEESIINAYYKAIDAYLTSRKKKIIL